MTYVRRNAMALLIGAAIGYFAVPYAMNLVKNR